MTNRLREALGTAEAGLRNNPNFARLFFLRGSAQQGLGRYEESISDFRRAIELSPRDPLAGAWYANIGGDELNLGHFQAAIEEVHKGLDAGYRTYIPHAYLAAAHALAGNGDEAKAALAEARRLNPNLTVKWAVAHSPNMPLFFEGLRKAGMPEE